MEFFTTAAGISVHVWDTKDEKDSRSVPGVSERNKPCLVLLHGYLETLYIFTELA